MACRGIYNLPKRFEEVLPDIALEVYRNAYKFAWEFYKGDKERSHRFAWKAVKKSINEMITQVKWN